MIMKVARLRDGVSCLCWGMWTKINKGFTISPLIIVLNMKMQWFCGVDVVVDDFLAKDKELL